MDVDSSSLIYDEFSSLIGTECTTFDDFDEFLPKTESIDYLSEQINNKQSSFTTIFDNNNFNLNNIPNELIKMETNFNPDEFLNYYQSEENKLNYTAGRNTPSPTNSSSSFSSDSNSLPTSNSSSLSSSSTNNQRNDKVNSSINILLDTPPISPIENIYNTIGNKQQIINGGVCGPVKLLQGTIIPISKLPHLVANKQNPTEQNSKPKTIVLSSKDFKKLMERCNDKQNLNNLPKLIVKQNTINKTISLYPKIVPQQQQHQQQQNNLNPKILPKPDIKMINSIIDEKTLKKQQRMIKNRKSACLSRMKKKDYVASLEKKLNILEKENTDLKVENTSLRCQLDIFTKQCLCNCKRKFSDIISLSNTNNNNRNKLSLNKILMGSTLRKNTAVLLAMIFMVSINFGTINNLLKPQLDLGVDKLQNSISSKQSLIDEHYGVRGLLWIKDDNTNTSTIKTNFLNNTQQMRNNLPLQRRHHVNNKKLTNYKICPMFINQTENLRLASELHKWIDTNDYLNLSTSAIMRPFKYQSDYENKKNTDFQQLFKNINNFVDDNTDVYMKNKKNYFNRNFLRKNKKYTKLNAPQKNVLIDDLDKTNPIEVFQPKLENKYRKLFEEIRRRDDTFYVVSFNTEHILLPASAYNKTSRPKMSLMLPASDTLLNGKFTLMQIDCEVLNTTLVELKEELIPKNLRPKFNNNNNNRNVNVPTRTHDKNTTATAQNQQFNLLNKNNFNNITPPIIVPTKKLLNRIRKHQRQHEEINELSDLDEDDNEFHKKPNNFNHIYKPYFIKAQFQAASSNVGNITNDAKINNHDKLLP